MENSDIVGSKRGYFLVAIFFAVVAMVALSAAVVLLVTKSNPASLAALLPGMTVYGFALIAAVCFSVSACIAGLCLSSYRSFCNGLVESIHGQKRILIRDWAVTLVVVLHFGILVVLFVVFNDYLIVDASYFEFFYPMIGVDTVCALAALIAYTLRFASDMNELTE